MLGPRGTLVVGFCHVKTRLFSPLLYFLLCRALKHHSQPCDQTGRGNDYHLSGCAYPGNETESFHSIGTDADACDSPVTPELIPRFPHSGEKVGFYPFVSLRPNPSICTELSTFYLRAETPPLRYCPTVGLKDWAELETMPPPQGSPGSHTAAEVTTF